MRICFIGDSFVHGTGDDECLGWAGRLSSAARKSGCDLTCYNLGVRRDTSADIALRWRAEAQARLPEGHDGRLVFSFGANDCTPTDTTGAVRVAHAQALENAAAILGAANGWRSTLFVGPLPVCDDPITDERIARLSEDLTIVCAGVGVPYLPVFSLALTSEVWRREAAAGDGTHPNTRGYTWLSELVSAWSAWQECIRGNETIACKKSAHL